MSQIVKEKCSNCLKNVDKLTLKTCATCEELKHNAIRCSRCQLLHSKSELHKANWIQLDVYVIPEIQKRQEELLKDMNKIQSDMNELAIKRLELPQKAELWSETFVNWISEHRETLKVNSYVGLAIRKDGKKVFFESLSNFDTNANKSLNEYVLKAKIGAE